MTTALPSNETSPVTELPVDRIQPNPRNPRRINMHAAAVAEMTRSIQAEGLLEPVLVRLVEETPIAGSFYELIAGERRWRAFKGMGRKTIPARVLAADEASGAIKCLVAFLQSRSATPMEEARGYRDALDLRDSKGLPVFTVEAIAARTGKSEAEVRRRALLCDLPEAGQKALLQGRLDERQGYLIARLPEPEARAALLAEVLKFDPPLTVNALENLMAEKWLKSLSGAPFNRTDAKLLPAAGSCETCPHRTGANPGRFGECKGKAAQMCTRPDCFRAKVEAARVAVAEELMAEGYEVLDAEACEREFIPGGNGLRYDSDFVVVGQKISADLLKKEVTNVPTWQEVLDKAKATPPRFAGFDQGGTVVHLVRRSDAIAAVDADPQERHIFRESDRKAARPGRAQEPAKVVKVARDGVGCDPIAAALIGLMEAEVASWGKKFSGPLQTRIDVWRAAGEGRAA